MSTLLMWAIHSCFSVAVAAYTANDFPRVQISQPFLNWPSSSRDCSFTSWGDKLGNHSVCSSGFLLPTSSGMMCCVVYFFLLMMMFPYTSTSLNRKNCRGFGFFLQALVSTPSPTRTRPDEGHQLLAPKTPGLSLSSPGTARGWPADPKHCSTSAILRAFAVEFTVTPLRYNSLMFTRLTLAWQARSNLTTLTQVAGPHLSPSEGRSDTKPNEDRSFSHWLEGGGGRGIGLIVIKTIPEE